MQQQVPIIETRTPTVWGHRVPGPIRQYGPESLGAYVIPAILSPLEVGQVRATADQWLPTSITGMRGNYVPGEREWSYRYNFSDPDLADTLWKRIRGSLPVSEIQADDSSYLDVSDGLWVSCGVSSVFRVIKYPEGGYLVPHYDAPFPYSETRLTLYSLVIELGGGDYPTRFLNDAQSETPVGGRDLSDIAVEFDGKGEPVVPGPSRLMFTPESLTPGSATIFPHRRLHDTTPVGPGGKMIARSDIIFRKVSE